MNNRPIVFFDLDGTICAFIQGALAFHQRTDIPVSDIRWGIEEQLGMTAKDFWNPLGKKFWANLEPLADGMELLKVAEELIPPENIAIFTSPCATDGCTDGKRDWAKKHLKRYSKNLLIGSAKHLAAQARAILVDDRDENCDAFIREGGRAVLVPRPWNVMSRHCVGNGSFDVTDIAMHLRRTITAAGG